MAKKQPPKKEKPLKVKVSFQEAIQKLVKNKYPAYEPPKGEIEKRNKIMSLISIKMESMICPIHNKGVIRYRINQDLLLEYDPLCCAFFENEILTAKQDIINAND